MSIATNHSVEPCRWQTRFLLDCVFGSRWVVAVFFVLLAANTVPAAEAIETRPALNVLFIAVDDLRPRLECYGESGAQSPNIDRLASEGVVFRNAFCQFAACNPSRSSLMTSRRPDTTTVFDNRRRFRSALPDVVTLPQQFKRLGYFTCSLGKVIHGTYRADKAHEDPLSWSVPEWRPDYVGYATPEGLAVLRRRFPSQFGDRARYSAAETMAHRGYPGLAWESPDVPDDALFDGRLANKAIEVLREVKDRPFFLAVGFIKPHAPYVAPKKYFDLHNLDAIELPANDRLPRDGTPLAHADSAEVRGYEGVPARGPISLKTQRELVRAYNACVSYVDAQIGRILDELARLGLRENTVVVLWGDHGYHLGHNGLWGKNTNFDSAARVPLIVSAPGLKAAGKTSDALVELVDLYPTLCDVCGVPLPEGLEGTSFRPLLDTPNRPWKKAAFTQHSRPLGQPGASMGRSMRTDRYRLTEWTGPRLKKPVHELYDYQTDPGETVNLANRPEYKSLREDLTAQLDAGWKAALPSESRPVDQRLLFSFGLIADVQYSDEPDRPPRAYRTSLDRLRQCVTELNRHPIDFTIQLGDVIDGNTSPEKTREDLDRVMSEFARLDKKLYHVVGNHCLNAGREELEKKLGLARAYYDFTPEGVEGWRLIVLDGNDAGYGVLGEEQTKWLEATLAKARQRGERVIVFNHFALLKQAAAHSRMKRPEPARSMLGQSGCVVAYFAGHEHAGGFAEDRGIYHVTLQGMVEAPEQNAFAIVKVFDDRIEIEGFGKVPSRCLPHKTRSPKSGHSARPSHPVARAPSPVSFRGLLFPEPWPGR
ncbi:MAG: sulfatase-like hydrolase/transferase [Pirellulales bacterium]|nr:sulfatase-like hydrolase/transferase [Pirellulales bacterium]